MRRPSSGDQVVRVDVVSVVDGLPKTRSGKILRRTMRGIADGPDEPVPSTIEDPAVLDALRRVPHPCSAPPATVARGPV